MDGVTVAPSSLVLLVMRVQASEVLSTVFSAQIHTHTHTETHTHTHTQHAHTGRHTVITNIFFIDGDGYVCFHIILPVLIFFLLWRE